VIVNYHAGRLPILAPLTLLQHYLAEHPDDYLLTQSYILRSALPGQLTLRLTANLKVPIRCFHCPKAIGGYNAARFHIREADQLPAAGSPVAGFIRELSMFTLMQKHVKSRVRVRAAACAQLTSSQLSFMVAKQLRLLSNWITTSCGTSRTTLNSTAKF
jgi:hypothetical protein